MARSEQARERESIFLYLGGDASQAGEKWRHAACGEGVHMREKRSAGRRTVTLERWWRGSWRNVPLRLGVALTLFSAGTTDHRKVDAQEKLGRRT